MSNLIILPPLVASSHTNCRHTPAYTLLYYIPNTKFSYLERQVVNKFVTCVRHTCNLKGLIFLQRQVKEAYLLQKRGRKVIAGCKPQPFNKTRTSVIQLVSPIPAMTSLQTKELSHEYIQQKAGHICVIETDCIHLGIYGTVFLTYLVTTSATHITPSQQEV